VIRGRAEYLGGTRVRFVWPCGHTETRDYSKGPIPKRVGATGVRFLTKYWSSGGVTLPRCKRCQRKETP
jgi:hypothetical protein